MESEEIKKECKKMYAQIKVAEDRLQELRAKCKHEKTFERKCAVMLVGWLVCRAVVLINLNF